MKGVRIQMPVAKQLAEMIRSAAAEVEHSPRWFVVKMLHLAADQHRVIFQAVSKGMAQAIKPRKPEAVQPLPSQKPLPLLRGREYERFDVMVKPKAWAVVSLAAEVFSHKESRMAGLLLEWGDRELGTLERVRQTMRAALLEFKE